MKNAMKDEYKIITENEFKAARFIIKEDLLELDGNSFKYSYVKIRPGICVLIKVGLKFAVIKEYRYPIRQWSYEFCAGMIDDGETPYSAAGREIMEETGYIPETLMPLGSFYPSFGATDELIHLFYAECRSKKETARERSELMQCELLSYSEIENLIMSGKFMHGAGLAAWLRYKLCAGDMEER